MTFQNNGLMRDKGVFIVGLLLVSFLGGYTHPPFDIITQEYKDQKLGELYEISKEMCYELVGSENVD